MIYKNDGFHPWIPNGLNRNHLAWKSTEGGFKNNKQQQKKKKAENMGN